jgi:hypothetical protein
VAGNGASRRCQRRPRSRDAPPARIESSGSRSRARDPKSAAAMRQTDAIRVPGQKINALDREPRASPSESARNSGGNSALSGKRCVSERSRDSAAAHFLHTSRGRRRTSCAVLRACKMRRALLTARRDRASRPERGAGKVTSASVTSHAGGRGITRRVRETRRATTEPPQSHSEHSEKHKRRNSQLVEFGRITIVAILLALLVFSPPSVPLWLIIRDSVRGDVVHA